MASPKKILFLTNQELGQANVFLATAHEMVQQLGSTVEVHFSSFAPLEKHVKVSSEFALASHAASEKTSLNGSSTNASPAPFAFHPISGRTMFTAMSSPEVAWWEVMALPPGLINGPKAVEVIISKLHIPWSQEEFLTLFAECVRVILALKPDLVVVDALLAAGLTACKFITTMASTETTYPQFQWAILSPNTLKDWSYSRGGMWQLMTAWPAIQSGFPAPLPWYLVPFNMYLTFRVIKIAMGDKRMPAIREWFKLHALDAVRDALVAEGALASSTEDGATTTDGEDAAKPSESPLSAAITETPQIITQGDFARSTKRATEGPVSRVPVLINNLREIEFPWLGPLLPSAVPVGPITKPFDPSLETRDPELAAWLKRGPTVFIALGTHCALDEAEALRMAGALRILFDRAAKAVAADAKKGAKDGDAKHPRGLDRLQVLWKLKQNLRDNKQAYETGKGSKIHAVLADMMDADRVRIVEWLEVEPGAVLASGRVVADVNHGGASSWNEALV